MNEAPVLSVCPYPYIIGTPTVIFRNSTICGQIGALAVTKNLIFPPKGRIVVFRK